MKNIKRVKILLMLLILLSISIIFINNIKAEVRFNSSTIYQETENSTILELNGYSLQGKEEVKNDDYETVYKLTYYDNNNIPYYKNNVIFNYDKFINGHFITYNIHNINSSEVLHYNNGYICYSRNNKYYVGKYNRLNYEAEIEIEKGNDYVYITNLKSFLYNNKIYVFYNSKTSSESLDIVVCTYSLDGKLDQRHKFQGSSDDSLYDVLLYNNSFYLVGHTNSSDGDYKNKPNSLYGKPFVMKYNNGNYQIVYTNCEGYCDNGTITISNDIIILTINSHIDAGDKHIKSRLISCYDLEFNRYEEVLGQNVLENKSILNLEITGIEYNNDLYVYEVNENNISLYQSIDCRGELRLIKSWQNPHQMQINHVSSFKLYDKMYLIINLSSNDEIRNVIYEIDDKYNFKEVLMSDDCYFDTDGAKLYSCYGSELVIYSYMKSYPKEVSIDYNGALEIKYVTLDEEDSFDDDLRYEGSGYGIFSGELLSFYNDCLIVTNATYTSYLKLNSKAKSGQVFDIGKSFNSNAIMLLDGKEYLNDTEITELGNHTLQLSGENIEDISFSFVIKDLDETKNIEETIFDYKEIEVTDNFRSDIKNASSVIDNTSKVTLNGDDYTYPVIVASLILSIIISVIFIKKRRKNKELESSDFRKNSSSKKKKKKHYNNKKSNYKKGNNNYYKNNNYHKKNNKSNNRNYQNNYNNKNRNNNYHKKKHYGFILFLSLVLAFSLKPLKATENSENVVTNEIVEPQKFEVYFKEEKLENDIICNKYKIKTVKEGIETKKYLCFDEEEILLPFSYYEMFEYNKNVYAISLSSNILYQVTDNGLKPICTIKYSTHTFDYISNSNGFIYQIKDNKLYIAFSSFFSDYVTGYTDFNDIRFHSQNINLITINLDTFEISNKYLGGNNNQYIIDMFVTDHIYIVGCKEKNSDGDFGTSGKLELNTFISKVNLKGEAIDTFTVDGYSSDTKAFMFDRNIYLLSQNMLYKFDKNLNAIDKMKVDSNNIFVNENNVYEFKNECVTIYDIKNKTKYDSYYIRSNQKVYETNEEGISYLIFQTNERIKYNLDIISSKIENGKLILNVRENDIKKKYMCDVVDYRSILPRYIYRSDDYDYNVRSMYDVLEAKKEYKEFFDVMNSGIYHIDLLYYGMYEYVRPIEVEVLEECNVIEGLVYPVGYNLIFSGDGYLNDINIANNHQIKASGSYTLKQVFLDGSEKITNFTVDEKQSQFTNSSVINSYTYNVNKDVTFDFFISDGDILIKEVFINDTKCDFTFYNNHLIINNGKKEKGEYIDLINGFSYIKDDKEYYYSINKPISYEVLNDSLYVEAISIDDKSVIYNINDSDNLKRNIIVKYINSNSEETKVYPLNSFTLKVEDINLSDVSSVEVLLSYCVSHTMRYISLFSIKSNFNDNDVIGTINYNNDEIEFKLNEKNKSNILSFLINGNSKFISETVEITSVIKKGVAAFVLGIVVMFIITSFIPQKKKAIKKAQNAMLRNEKKEKVKEESKKENVKPKGVFTQNLYFTGKKEESKDDKKEISKEEEMYIEELRKNGTIAFIEQNDLDGLDDEEE